MSVHGVKTKNGKTTRTAAISNDDDDDKEETAVPVGRNRVDHATY
jgi:hypothetical protein